MNWTNESLLYNNPAKVPKKHSRCSDWPSSKLQKFPSGLTQSNTCLRVELEPRVSTALLDFINSPKRGKWNEQWAWESRGLIFLPQWIETTNSNVYCSDFLAYFPLYLLQTEVLLNRDARTYLHKKPHQVSQRMSSTPQAPTPFSSQPPYISPLFCTQQPFSGLFPLLQTDPNGNFPLKLHQCGTWVFYHQQHRMKIKTTN